MITIQNFTSKQVTRLKEMGRTRTSETYQAMLNSFTHFCNNQPFPIQQINNDTVERYEAWLKQRQLSRNSSSFYMRVLRRIYNMAVEEGLVEQGNPFRMVYTGIDKTSKRAITETDIRRIKQLELGDQKSMIFVRDMFLLSFYLRGMSFIDMANLRKHNLRNGYLTYNRRKTGQRLSIRWEKAMQDIINRHPNPTSDYLLPIITCEDGTERRQYQKLQLRINRNLKAIGRMAHLHIPLTMYVARHSWASIAHRKHVPITVISEGMGHDSESTTQIYLSTIQTNLVDRANQRIIHSI